MQYLIPRPNFDFWSNIPILIVNFSKTNLFYLNKNIRPDYTCLDDKNYICQEMGNVFFVDIKIE